MHLPTRNGKRLKGFLKLLLKIVVTALCFWYISDKIDFGSALRSLATANWWYVAAAIAMLAASKWVSAIRLKGYFRLAGISVSNKINFGLYWLGMFYNLFLPGSISGDAYKVMALKKAYKASYRKTSAAVLLDRFSGLLALGLLMGIYGFLVPGDDLADWILAGGAILAVAALYLIIRWLFPDFRAGFWLALYQGIAVQGLQVICIYLLMASVGISPDQPAWVLVFLAASVISVLPLSLGGGLGTRELVFLKGAEYFGFDPALAITVSLFFYLAGLFISLPGIYYIFHSPLKVKKA